MYICTYVQEDTESLAGREVHGEFQALPKAHKLSLTQLDVMLQTIQGMLHFYVCNYVQMDTESFLVERCTKECLNHFQRHVYMQGFIQWGKGNIPIS